MSLHIVSSVSFTAGALSLATYFWLRDQMGATHDAELWLIGPSNNVADRHRFNLKPGRKEVEYEETAIPLEGTTSYTWKGTRVWLVDADHGAPFSLEQADEDNAPLLERMDGFRFYKSRESQRLLEFEQAASGEMESFMNQVPYLLKMVLAALVLIIGMIAASAGWIGGGV